MAVREREKPDREALPFDRWLTDPRLPDAGYGPREFWGDRDGELVAAVQVYLRKGESDQVALTRITVAPGRRQVGIGTAVLHLLLPLLEAHGRTVVAGWDLAQDGPGRRWVTAVGLRTAKSMWSRGGGGAPREWHRPARCAGGERVRW